MSDNYTSTLHRHAIGSKFGHPITPEYQLELRRHKLSNRFKTSMPQRTLTNLPKQDRDKHIYVPIGSTAGETIPE